MAHAMSEFDVNETIRGLESGKLPAWIADHLRCYLETNGREGHHWDATAVGGKGLTPCLLLTTVGRRSGQKRPMPLIYGRAGDALIVIGSKGGSDTQPAWYWNLLAEPRVDVQVGAGKFAARARIAEGEERARL